MEKEALESQMMIEQQREQKESLKKALEEQIYQKQTLAKYNKEIEREAEKALMVVPLFNLFK